MYTSISEKYTLKIKSKLIVAFILSDTGAIYFILYTYIIGSRLHYEAVSKETYIVRCLTYFFIQWSVICSVQYTTLFCGLWCAVVINSSGLWLLNLY